MKATRWALSILAVVWLVACAWAVFAPEPGWYDYHHSYNEHWYSSIVRGELGDGARLPPGYPWLATFGPLALLEPVVALRLVSILAAASLVLVTWKVKGLRQAALVASLPWVIVWGTRAQTDMLAASAVWIGLLLASARANFFGGLVIGLGSFVKPTALLGATKPNWRFLVGVALGTIPFGAWLGRGGLNNVGFHASHGVPFGNVGNLFGLLAGLGFTVALLRRSRAARHEWAAIALLLLFALWKAPLVHEYYLLPALVGLALIADTSSRWFWPLVAANATLGLAMLTWLASKAGTRIDVALAMALIGLVAWSCFFLATRAQPRIHSPPRLDDGGPA